MIFNKTSISGLFLIELDKIHDERGYFSRVFDIDEIQKIEKNFSIVQSSISFNKYKGTVRGMHFQKAPHEEIKLVQCVKGSIFDVLIDLRRDSNTYLKHEPFELNDVNNHLLLIPKGIAHGFQTLVDDTLVMYHMSEQYHPNSGMGVKFDDPLFGIKWKLPVTKISPKDTSYPDYIL